MSKTTSHEKEILRVLSALREGFETSRDIAEETGIPSAHVSVWLGELVACDLAKITHRKYGGRRFNRYAPT